MPLYLKVRHSQINDSGKSKVKLPEQEANQEQIVEAGGLTSLLLLLKSSEDEMIHKVAASAIANLAMNGEYLMSLINSTLITETNKEQLMNQGGISLLLMTAADADDPQTLCMVAGAIANLCGNVTPTTYGIFQTSVPVTNILNFGAVVFSGGALAAYEDPQTKNS
ncbi:hypothetical protein IFM89_024197 [Coptis chinensis]|uniref:Vacuolar protein 8 n=1 Tax=Coptis chinensis TaxID=261450 RepID=A0A835HFA8_9MAGN|nr:hypothetical protein IFM89_024197 [Coptis chinensis]